MYICPFLLLLVIATIFCMSFLTLGNRANRSTVTVRPLFKNDYFITTKKTHLSLSLQIQSSTNDLLSTNYRTNKHGTTGIVSWPVTEICIFLISKQTSIPQQNHSNTIWHYLLWSSIFNSLNIITHTFSCPDQQNINFHSKTNIP